MANSLLNHSVVNLQVQYYCVRPTDYEVHSFVFICIIIYIYKSFVGFSLIKINKIVLILYVNSFCLHCCYLLLINSGLKLSGTTQFIMQIIFVSII